MKIQFILITAKGERITNTKLFDEDSQDEEMGCVVEFNHIPMMQDYSRMVNKIAGLKQFEVDNRIVKFETNLLGDE